MQVRIGVQSVAKEIVVDTTVSADEIEQSLMEALQTENGVFILVDERGGRVVVPAAHVGYLEISEDESRSVGFSTF
ncbi:MAG: hypothetical protein QOE54_1271 [Streptosporangiaceae bacterium]|nr:hypothetical protein [Streptosporangiaceae bacterium]MDX6428905.1 hypothetical protein [Streptosporangiaceae bacterium]